MTPIVLNLKPFVELSDEQFYQLCQNHRDLKFERTPQGELVIVTPVGGESGKWEADLIGDLVYWNRQSKLGQVFSSSTCFRLPNGGDRSPDAAWVAPIRRSRCLTILNSWMERLFYPVLSLIYLCFGDKSTLVFEPMSGVP